MPLYPQLQSGIGNNGINTLLFPVDINRKIIKEFVQITPLSSLIGNEPNRPIVRHNFRPGEGIAYRVARLNALDYRSPVLNYDQRRGKEQMQSVDADTVQCNWRTFAVKIAGLDVLRYATPIDLPPEAQSQIVQTYARNLNWDIFNSMSVFAYPNMGWDPIKKLAPSVAANCNVAGTLPSYDRAVPALATTRAQWQANQTFNTYLNGFQTSANTAPDGTGLSTKHLKTLKMYAERGGSDVEVEADIQPAYIKSRNGFPMNQYYYFAHPQTLTSLTADPLFVQTTIARGTVIDDNQPQMINGADYFGCYLGMHIYALPDLYNYTFTSADGTKKVAWNFLVGAGALSLGWAELPRFRMEMDDYESCVTYYGHEIRGQKLLQFPSRYVASAGAGAVVGSNPLVEQGIIHSFVSF